MILIQSSPLFSGHFCMACLKISCLWLSTWAISYLMLCIHYVLNGHGRRANVSLHQIQHFHFYIDLQHYILIFTGKWVTNNLVNMKFFIWNAIPPPPRESLVQLLFFFSSFPFKCTVEKLGCLGAQIGLSLEPWWMLVRSLSAHHVLMWSLTLLTFCLSTDETQRKFVAMEDWHTVLSNGGLKRDYLGHWEHHGNVALTVWHGHYLKKSQNKQKINYSNVYLYLYIQYISIKLYNYMSSFGKHEINAYLPCAG